MMTNTLDVLKQEKIVVICRGIPSEKILDLAQALYQGGIRCIEVTFDQSSQEGIDNTTRCIQLLSQADTGLYVGAGTVMNKEQVRLAKAAGAKYILSPNVDEEVIQETKGLGMVSIPGAFTPTEVALAYRYGADIVKVFPVGQLGAAYIKALRGPLGHIPLLAVGGVGPANCEEYMKAGCVGIGVGGNLVSRTLVEEGRFDEVAAAARDYMEILHPNKT